MFALDHLSYLLDSYLLHWLVHHVQLSNINIIIMQLVKRSSQHSTRGRSSSNWFAGAPTPPHLDSCPCNVLSKRYQATLTLFYQWFHWLERNGIDLIFGNKVRNMLSTVTTRRCSIGVKTVRDKTHLEQETNPRKHLILVPRRHRLEFGQLNQQKPLPEGV